MLDLKVGTNAEAEDIKRMALAFFKASPYARFGVDEARVSDLVDTFLRGDPDKLTVCLMDGERAVGVLGAIAVRNIFNNRYTTIEMIWWVDPEYRGGNSLKMIKAYEFWAEHKINAQAIQLVSLGDLDYSRLGYTKHEEAWLKEVE